SYRFDGFELDTSLYELRRAGERIPVEPRALDVLHYLIVNRDRVVSKEELLDAVWGDRFVSEAAITTALRTARMAIGDTGKEQRLIRTVFRRGYQFTGTVAQTAAEPRPGDGHWADVQTLALTRHLVERALTTPVLVIGTFRDSDVDASHPLTALLAATHREPGITRLGLRGLDDGEVLDLLEAAAGHEMDRDGLALRDALRAETEGNPFFVTEILRDLAETGAISKRDDGRWRTPARLHARGLPVSVREVVVRRVERLGAGTRTALDTASIIGRDFELDLLFELLGEDPARTFERLAPAVDNAAARRTSRWRRPPRVRWSSPARPVTTASSRVRRASPKARCAPRT